MIYDIRHVTTYEYDAPVTFGRCLLRLMPAARAGQIIHAHELTIAPAPAQRIDRLSFFGARETLITLDKAHARLNLESRARVEVRRPIDADAQGAPWEQVREDAYRADAMEPTSPAHFIYPSAMAPLAGEVTRYARASFTAGRPILEAARDLMGRMHRDFSYDPTATIVSTPLIDAFRNRRGVCQDFAHIMIAALRGLGLPAAYASGYLRTLPPPGQQKLMGADATHAWVWLWAGAAGWVGLDPTNDVQVGEDHILIAAGRDYAEASPLEGVIFGADAQDLKVEVDVTPAPLASY